LELATALLSQAEVENIFNLVITTNNIYNFKQLWTQHLQFINKRSVFGNKIVK